MAYWTAEHFAARLGRLLKLSEGRLLGRFFAPGRQRLSDVAEHLGVHHLTNLASCPAR